MKFISHKTISLIRDTKDALYLYAKKLIPASAMRREIVLAVERFNNQMDFLGELS